MISLICSSRCWAIYKEAKCTIPSIFSLFKYCRKAGISSLKQKAGISSKPVKSEPSRTKRCREKSFFNQMLSDKTCGSGNQYIHQKGDLKFSNFSKVRSRPDTIGRCIPQSKPKESQAIPQS